MNKKTTVAVLYGGRSAEHEISLISAKNVLQAIDSTKYNVIEIHIDKKGAWTINKIAVQLLLNFGEGIIINSKNAETIAKIDVLYPVLHGPYGEDGTIQALAKLAGLPCVGPNMLSSAVSMDKDVAKRLLQAANINVAKFVTLRKYAENNMSYNKITDYLGKDLFVKPANMGSSVGVAFVDNEAEFNLAIADAYKYDDKVIVEEKIIGREIECAILGNNQPKSTVPGEIVPTKDFYSYKSKYIDKDGADLQVPAKLSDDIKKKAMELAIEAFKCLECKGMARVDMFLKENGEIVLNEINTIPGFTEISMYPKLWDYAGVSAIKLTDMLIQLAMEEFEHKLKLEYEYKTD